MDQEFQRWVQSKRMMDWDWIKNNCNVIVKEGKTYVELTQEIYDRIYLKLGSSREAIGRRLYEYTGLDYDQIMGEEEE